MIRHTKKILLVNRDFQLRYTRMAVVVGFFSTLLTVILILFPLFQFQILRFPNFVPYPFVIGMVVAALANFVMVAYFGIVLTHRIAGPMFSLVRQFRAVSGGNLNAKFNVREQDELKFVIRNFNEMVDGLAMRTLADLQKVDAILKTLSENAVPQALIDTEALRQDLASRINHIQGIGGSPPA